MRSPQRCASSAVRVARRRALAAPRLPWEEGARMRYRRTMRSRRRSTTSIHLRVLRILSRSIDRPRRDPDRRRRRTPHRPLPLVAAVRSLRADALTRAWDVRECCELGWADGAAAAGRQATDFAHTPGGPTYTIGYGDETRPPVDGVLARDVCAVVICLYEGWGERVEGRARDEGLA